MGNEIWKDVLDYEGLYQVSNLGRIRSLDRDVIMPKNGGIRKDKGKILKPTNNSRGYLYLNLCKNGKTSIKKVHRLVYEAFNGKTNLQIDHIVECNKTDNRLSNLQALTNRENTSKSKLFNKKSSIYTGVTWCNFYKKWKSRIMINKKVKHLGYFLEEIEADNAYKNALNNLLTNEPE